MKIGLQLNRFDYAGGTPAIGPTLARVAHGADEAGFDSLWVMDHFFQIRGLGPADGPDARGLDDPRLPGRPHAPGAPGAHGRRRPLPAARALGEGGDDPRRPVRRPRLARNRGCLEPGGERRPRLPDAAAGDPLRDARGDPPDRPRDVGRGARLGGTPRRRALRGRSTPELPAGHQPAPGADHDRRRRREEDAAPRGPVRRRHQRLRRPRHPAPQVRHPAPALRGRRPPVRRDRALHAPEYAGSPRTAPPERRRRRPLPSASPPSPRPAPST